ncbi:MAG: hypothetical protein WC269_05740, partial [Candidatus Gracilibacteria bacterium]
VIFLISMNTARTSAAADVYRMCWLKEGELLLIGQESKNPARALQQHGFSQGYSTIRKRFIVSMNPLLEVTALGKALWYKH